jgi:hypothetical protein
MTGKGESRRRRGKGRKKRRGIQLTFVDYLRYAKCDTTYFKVFCLPSLFLLL